MTKSTGWLAAAVLPTTIGRQVGGEWRDGGTKRFSRWRFIGQITPSHAFTVYRGLPRDGDFVVTNMLMLDTAVMGEWVLPANRRRAAAFSGRGR